jgi:hypothetical protein
MTDREFRERVFRLRRAHFRGVMDPNSYTECSAAAEDPCMTVPAWTIRSSESQVTILSEADPRAQQFKASMDKCGSDKASAHSYHLVYPGLLSNPSLIVEIGTGSRSERIPSAMGEGGAPGGSLRAWRIVYPGSNVIGADIDVDALVEEPGIRTLWVDQLDEQAVSSLGNSIEDLSAGTCADLILDDGFHDTRANLTTLRGLWRCVRPGGWYVIEDVDIHRMPQMIAGIGILELNAEVAIVDLRSLKSRADDVLIALHKPPGSTPRAEARIP